MTEAPPDGTGQLATRLERDPIAGAWPAAARERYLEWSAVLMAGADLEITIGKGGLSFYLRAGKRRIFVIHFNAMPRATTTGRGFADFRRDSLEPYLNMEGALADLGRQLPLDSELRAARTWRSLHFPSDLTAEIAQTIATILVLPLARAAEATA